VLSPHQSANAPRPMRGEARHGVPARAAFSNRSPGIGVLTA
jgi:hypothetical protein